MKKERKYLFKQKSIVSKICFFVDLFQQSTHKDDCHALHVG